MKLSRALIKAQKVAPTYYVFGIVVKRSRWFWCARSLSLSLSISAFILSSFVFEWYSIGCILLGIGDHDWLNFPFFLKITLRTSLSFKSLKDTIFSSKSPLLIISSFYFIIIFYKSAIFNLLDFFFFLFFKTLFNIFLPSFPN